ncbi:MAG: hypothetical protein PHI55_04720, partial [Burkholderiaceae bacterium]|nr:hypothetical protein [Burkholderiaceae bacterium]
LWLAQGVASAQPLPHLPHLPPLPPLPTLSQPLPGTDPALALRLDREMRTSPPAPAPTAVPAPQAPASLNAPGPAGPALPGPVSTFQQDERATLAGLVLLALLGAGGWAWRRARTRRLRPTDNPAAASPLPPSAPRPDAPQPVAPPPMAPIAPPDQRPAAPASPASPVRLAVAPPQPPSPSGAPAEPPAATVVLGARETPLEPAEAAQATDTAPLAPPVVPPLVQRAPRQHLRSLPAPFAALVRTGQYLPAMQLLQESLETDTSPAPLACLELLRLFHTFSRVDDFNALRAQFHRRFNAQIPVFAHFKRQGSHLVDYPEVLADIETHWAEEAPDALVDLLEHYLYRSNHRPGVPPFDLAAFDDLMLLHAIAESLD